MLRTLRSNAITENPQFRRMHRHGRENNMRLIARADVPMNGDVTIVFVGGRSAQDVRLRVAQSHVRADLTPSAWSHVAMLGPRADRLDDTVIYEIALDPPGGFGFPPRSNGVQTTTLGRYRSAIAYPNIAVAQFPVPLYSATAQLEALRDKRGVLDLLELLIPWLAFAWGVGRAANPLFDGLGIPSAAMTVAVIAAAGEHQLDPTPGLASRASCPEALFQSTRWWHHYYEENAATTTDSSPRAPSGMWCISHDLCIDPVDDRRVR